MATENQVDVVIVGGGLAGLSAALRLNDSQKTFVLLEGEERLGGRTLMRVDAKGNGYDCEFGGGYVGAAQNYVVYLLRRFGIPTFRQYLPKNRSWLFEYSDGREPKRYKGDDPLDLPGGDNARFILGYVDTLALELRHYLPEPWNHPQADLYDSMTVARWMEEERAKWDAQADPKRPDIGMSPDTADAFLSAVHCAFSLEPHELSFFFLLYYSACAGSFAALVDVAGGEAAAEGTRLRFGTKSLVDAMYAELPAPSVRQGVKVEHIQYEAEGVTVTADQGVWHAKHVIVAMSPPASKRINYEPQLEKTKEGLARLGLCNEMEKSMGRTIKGFVRFKEAFWRERARDSMGFLLSAGPKETCPVSWTLDNVWNPGAREFVKFASRPEFQANGPNPPRVPPPFENGSEPQNPTNRLMTFIVGDAATYWAAQTLPERAKAVVRHLQKVYKFETSALYDSTDLAANYVEENWLTRSAQGIPAPAAMMPPLALTRFGSALRTPVGRRLHWAGSESAQEWCGYMNGAVESGFRAASDILRTL